MSEQEKTWRAEERALAAGECCDVNGLDHCPFHLQLIEERIESRRAIAQAKLAEQERALEAAVVDAALHLLAETKKMNVGEPDDVTGWEAELLGRAEALRCWREARARGEK